MNRTLSIFMCWLGVASFALLPAQVVPHRRKAFRTPAGPSSPGTANLLAWYDLSTVNDASTNAYHLTNSSPAVAFNTGLIGNGAFADATSKYLQVADANWQHNMANLSISLWLKPDDGQAANAQYPLGKFNSTTDRCFFIAILTTGELRFAVSGDGSTLPFTDSAYQFANGAAGAWVHVVVTWEASTRISVYINGSQSGTPNTTSIPASLYNSTSVLMMFNRGDLTSTNHYLGGIDSVGIFNDVLTADEITWLYNSGSGRQFSDL